MQNLETKNQNASLKTARHFLLAKEAGQRMTLSEGVLMKNDKRRNLIEWGLMLVVAFIVLFLFDQPGAELAASNTMAIRTSAPAEVRSVKFAGAWRVVVAPTSGSVTGPRVYWVVPFLHIVID